MITLNVEDVDNTDISIATNNIPNWIDVTYSVVNYTISGIAQSTAEVTITGIPTQDDLGSDDFTNANYFLTSSNVYVAIYDDSNATASITFDILTVYEADAPVVEMDYATTSIKETVDVSSMLMVLNITDEDGYLSCSITGDNIADLDMSTL